MIKILFIPKPLPEESPTSMLKRMAVRHGCRLRSDLHALFGKSSNYRSIFTRTHPIVQHIARQAGMDGESFLDGFYEPIGPSPTSPPLKIYGLVVKANVIRKRSAAYCSECGEGSHEYFIKDLIFSVYCPYHMRKYLAKCPHCNSDLHWTNLLTGGCECKEVLVSPPCRAEDANIEKKLLSLFRSGDSDQYMKFEKHLLLLGYRRKSRSDCQATRTIIALALALLENEKEVILNILREFRQLYPEVPARIICAKLAQIPSPQFQGWVKDFLREQWHENGYLEEITFAEPVAPFSLSCSQIRAWQKLGIHQWKILLRQTNLKPHNYRYSWSQAQSLAEKTLELRLNNGFSQKKKVTGLSVNQLKENLSLTIPAITGLIAEKLLTPIPGCRGTLLFDAAEVESLSTNYISMQRLSASSQISTNRIRNTIKDLYLYNRDFNTRRLCFLVMSVQTGQLIVNWCKKQGRRKKHPLKRPTAILSNDKWNQTGVWLSAQDAGRSLCVNASTIRHLIRIGLIPFRLRDKNNYLINENAIESFRLEYIGLTEASNLLHWPISLTREKLKEVGIIPISGLDSIKKRPYYFSRQQIATYSIQLEKLRKENGAGYTITEVRQRLFLSLPAVLSMVRVGIMKFTDPTHLAIQKKCVDEFYDIYATLPMVATWLNIPPSCVYKALVKYGIEPISDIPPTSQCIYSIDDIAQHFSVPARPTATSMKTNKKMEIVRVSLFRKKYDCSAVAFGKLFVKSGFVKTIEAYGPAYLLAEDAKKIADILDEYLTFPHVVKYFGSQTYPRKLILSNKLAIARPLLPYSNLPMIAKKVLRDYSLLKPLAQTPPNLGDTLQRNKNISCITPHLTNTISHRN